MQNTSADYKLEINKPSRSFECKATIGNNIYTNEDIVDIILDYPQSSDGFTIGNTISQTLDLTLINKRDVIYSTSQVKVEIGLKIGSKIEYILMGYYNIDDIEKTDYTTKLTCYDNMIKFETPYFSELRDNPTLQQVVNELSKITGIQFEGSLPAYTVSKLGGFSCREVLSYVASICGGNALITRNGNFTIKGLSEVSKTINGDNYFGFKTEEVKYKVGKISCQVDENNVLSKGALGTDSMELSFENPWITENILTDIYNKLNGLSYLGYSMKWQGDLSLDPYDIIAVTDVKNVTRKMPILSQKLTYTGGLTSEIEAKGESKNKNFFSSSGSTTNKVNRLITEQAVIKDALINKANIKDLEAVSIKTQTLEAKTAKIEEAIIDVAYIKDLNVINANIEKLVAADATINNALIGKADITQLNAVQGNINTLNSQVANIETLVNGNLTSDNIQSLILSSSKVTVENGFIKNAMIENLDVSKINAGTISTDKFLIRSNDGGIEINGATQQFKDSKNRVRLQLGKDSQGNFNFILRGEDGTSVLLDHTGLKAKAITDGLIVNNMLGQGAVTGDKVNIGSLIQEVNKDSNTSTIKATKIQLDKEGQSLDIAFNTLKTNVDNIQVGGRNLLINSKNYEEWTLHGASITDEYYGGTKVWRSTQRWKYILPPFVNVEAGKTYTLSAWVKSTNAGSQVACYTWNSNAEGRFNIPEANKWFKYIFTRTVTETQSVKPKIEPSSQIENDGTIIYFAGMKFEEGNKATDWTPAPEDIENRIESNTTQITAQQGKIEALISDTSIVEDGATKKLKDAYANLKLTVNGLNSTIGSHTTNITNLQGQMSTVNSNISNLSGKVQTVESKQVSFEQNLSGISQKVSSAESNIVTLKGQMTTANNNIASANNKIDGLQVGGRNLATKSNTLIKGVGAGGISCVQNSDGSITVTSTHGNGNWFTGFYGGDHELIESSFKEGDKFTISFTMKSSNTATPPSIYIKPGMGYYGMTGSLSSEYSTVYYSGVWKKANGINLHLGFGGTIGTITIKNIKIEKGNKATDWSPAPEDIESDINSVDSKITTTNNKVTELTTNLNGITQRVQSTESTVSTHTTQLGTVDNRINTAKNAAISAAATDATSKANNAQSKALADAKSYTNGQITTVNKTITDKVAEIKTTTDAITQRVSSTETKVNTVTTNFNNLQVGGTNMARDTNKGIIGWDWGMATGGRTISEVTENGIKCCKMVRDSVASTSWSYIYYSSSRISREKYLPNKQYTVSFEVKSSVATKFNMSIKCGNSLYPLTNNVDTDTCIVNTWTKLSATLTTLSTLPTETSQVLYFYGMNTNTGVSYIFRNLKIEEGNKATAWTPCPDDINNSINSVDSKVTTTNNKVSSIESTVSGITSKVTSLESTTSTINGNIANLQQRMSTAESKITSNAIINTVSSTINAAKQEAINSANSNTANQLKSYVTTSSLTQTVDSITAKFTSNGGHNLIKNGKAKNGTYGWINNGGGIHDVLDGKFGTCFGTAAPSGIAHEFIKLKNDTDYVYEAYIYSKQVIIGSAVAPLHFWCSTTQGAGQAQATIVSYRQQVGAINTWTKCYVHFKTKPTGDVWFRPFIYVGGSAAFDLWATEISLTESKVETAWTPHPSEIYEGSTVIDASGVTVNNGALRVNNKAGQTVLSGDSNGNLIYKGKMRQEASNGNYAELYPLEINNGHISYQMWLGSAQSDFRIKWDGGNEMAYFGAGGFQTDNYMTLRCLSDNNKTLYFEKGTIRPATGNYGQLGTEGYYFNKVNTASVGRDRTAGKHLNVDAGTVFLRSSYGVDWNDGGVIASAAGYFRPYSNLAWALGSPNERWSTVYANAVNYPSDLTLKENIKYLLRDEVQIIPFSVKSSIADITTQELYDFVKDELYLAEFNYKLPECKKEEKFNSIGFIAQDIQGSVIGDKLLKNDDGILSYDSATYISVIAGALQKAIEKIEILENKIKVSI